MTDLLWLPPLVKAVATALLVLSAAVVAQALGPFWGALVASLPISAGPAYVFLSLRHDAVFVAASALGSLAANAATGLFLIVYGIAAGRQPPWRSLGAAVLAWLAAALAAQQVAWTPWTALAANLAVYGAGFVFLKPAESAPPASAPAQRRWHELPLRAVAVAAFVSLVVAASARLGPEATGIAAVFPVSLISLIVIARPRLGGAAAALLAVHALRPMLGFGVMLLALHLAIRPFGVAAALGLALAVSLLWSAALLVMTLRGRRGTAPPPPAPASRRPCRPAFPGWRYGSWRWSPSRRANASRRARTR